MDNETYLKMDYRAQPSLEYYTVRKYTPLEDRQNIQKEKFGKKALIYQAFCTCGQRPRTFIINESNVKEI